MAKHQNHKPDEHMMPGPGKKMTEGGEYSAGPIRRAPAPPARKPAAPPPARRGAKPVQPRRR